MRHKPTAAKLKDATAMPKKNNTDYSERRDLVSVEPLMVSVRTACEILGVGKNTLYIIMSTGKLTSKKLGSKTLITMASLKDFCKNLPDTRLRPPRLSGGEQQETA